MYRLLLIGSLLLFSCARAPLRDPAQAFRLVSTPPQLLDTYPLGSLAQAFERTLAIYETSKEIPEEFRVQGRVITKKQYHKALLSLQQHLNSWEEFHSFVLANFDFYEVYGDQEYGDVFSTGYYSPMIPARRTKIAPFTQPLYRLPKDLVTIDLAAFVQIRPSLETLKESYEEKQQDVPNLIGRLPEENRAKIVPYFDRAEIDKEESELSGKGLEIAWVDPVESFFLQIQGSGLLEFPDGSRLWLGYAGKNGAPYYPIGRELYHVIPKEQMSMQRIRHHLQTLTPTAQQELMNKNPSYVFFQEIDREGGLTYSGAIAVGGRTIASEERFFPKGTFAFMDISEPFFPSEEAIDPDPERATPMPRWVFDLDIGGAIKGGGRTDLYFGEGAEAERKAGAMKNRGRLWYVFPKATFEAH